MSTKPPRRDAYVSECVPEALSVRFGSKQADPAARSPKNWPLAPLRSPFAHAASTIYRVDAQGRSYSPAEEGLAAELRQVTGEHT